MVLPFQPFICPRTKVSVLRFSDIEWNLKLKFYTAYFTYSHNHLQWKRRYTFNINYFSYF